MLTVSPLARLPNGDGVGFATRTESMVDVRLVERKDKWNDEAQADQRRRDRAADD